MTKIFFDTEFTGLHQNTTLISIGLVAETGQTFYGEFTDYDTAQINDWLQENVVDNLILEASHNAAYLDEYRIKGDTETIQNAITAWFRQFESIEMWSDCLSYDWVLFCQIFGHAFSIPQNIYYIPFDICTLFKFRKIDPDTSREHFSIGEIPTMGLNNQKITGSKHNALWDAYVIRGCYNKLIAPQN